MKGPDVADIGGAAVLADLGSAVPFIPQRRTRPPRSPGSAVTAAPLVIEPGGQTAKAAPPPDPWAGWAPLPAEWLASRPPARRWLLRRPSTALGVADAGVLPLGKVGLLVAAGGAGKSMALVQLAVSLALSDATHVRDPARFAWFGGCRDGDTIRGGFEVATTGRVLLVLAEEDPEEARRRVYRAAEVYGLVGSPEWLPAVAALERRLVVLPAAGNTGVALTDPILGGPSRAAQVLRKRLDETEEPWAAVILDPLSRFAGADAEKDNRAATSLVQVLETLTEAPGGPAVLVAHHTSQGARQAGTLEATDARGVTGISDGIRWQCGLRPRPELADAPRLVDWRVTKSNYALCPSPLVLVRGDGGTLTVASDADRQAYQRAEQRAEEQAGAAEAARKAARRRGAERARDDL